MKTMQTKTISFELTDTSEDRVVKGYGSVFGNLDSDNDTIKKGSFTKTIKAWGPKGKNRIKLVSQHNMSRPVAKITEMYEDEKGLYFEAKFGTHTDGEDHYRMVKEGILNEFSVGFVGLQSEENEKGGVDFEEIKLYEISLVTVAANDEALVTDIKAKEILEDVLESDIPSKAKEHAYESALLKLAKVFEVAVPEVEETKDEAVETKANELDTLAKAFNL